MVTRTMIRGVWEHRMQFYSKSSQAYFRSHHLASGRVVTDRSSIFSTKCRGHVHVVMTCILHLMFPHSPTQISSLPRLPSRHQTLNSVQVTKLLGVIRLLYIHAPRFQGGDFIKRKGGEPGNKAIWYVYCSIAGVLNFFI